MGFYLRVQGDGTAVWAGSTLAVTNGSGTDTWTFNTQFGLPRASAYDVVADFVTWHNDGARPWTGVATTSWAVGTTTAQGKVQVTLASDVSTTWNGSADLLTLMDWTNATATSIGNGTAGAFGTVDVQLSVRNYIEHDKSAGVFSISNSWINGSGQFATRRPLVSGFLTELESLAMSDALKSAATPRQAVVYEKHGAAFRVLDLGDVTLNRGRDLYSVDLAVLG